MVWYGGLWAVAGGGVVWCGEVITFFHSIPTSDTVRCLVCVCRCVCVLPLERDEARSIPVKDMIRLILLK